MLMRMKTCWFCNNNPVRNQHNNIRDSDDDGWKLAGRKNISTFRDIAVASERNFTSAFSLYVFFFNLVANWNLFNCNVFLFNTIKNNKRRQNYNFSEVLVRINFSSFWSLILNKFYINISETHANGYRNLIILISLGPRRCINRWQFFSEMHLNVSRSRKLHQELVNRLTRSVFSRTRCTRSLLRERCRIFMPKLVDNLTCSIRKCSSSLLFLLLRDRETSAFRELSAPRQNDWPALMNCDVASVNWRRVIKATSSLYALESPPAIRRKVSPQSKLAWSAIYKLTS